MAGTTHTRFCTSDSKAVAAEDSADSWAVRDSACIWHPFTQAQIAPLSIPIVRGDGAYLYSEKNERYLDAVSSWWVNLHGHAHPYIAEKIATQAKELEHVIFAGYTHPQAIVLAERLLALLGNHHARVFYSDNGSTAVESAVKMAFQLKGEGKRILSFHGGYHGDTFGAMAAGGKSHFNRPFWPYMFEVSSILPPLFGKEEESWQEFEKALATNEIAAFIFEPLVQGVAGMVPHCTRWLSKMVGICQEKGIITIADEVMTGFGRTGPLFASSLLENVPDIICLSKGITGGFLPLGATLVKQDVFDGFLSSDPARAFLHGHSYSGNPLACAAANANLDLLLDPSCHQARRMIEKEHLQFKQAYGSHPKLLRCAVIGTILSLEYQAENRSYHHSMKETLTKFFQKEGILLRPFGNSLHVLPPYCITQKELQKIYSAIVVTLETDL